MVGREGRGGRKKEGLDKREGGKVTCVKWGFVIGYYGSVLGNMGDT